MLKKQEKADKLFVQVGKQLPDDIMDKGMGAKEENALKEVFETLKDIKDCGDIDRARRLWRIGRCYWDLGGESPQGSLQILITSLKHNRECILLKTRVTTRPTRASKCFQKAFKVDACEAEVARCPMEGFGDEHGLDLVEVVARRTIDGEGRMGADKEELCGVHQGLSSGNSKRTSMSNLHG
ncbi:hypothetical protein DFJ58DRAFT_842658 [Suillus subalutaceus]|uniref:uncharacterized protein n=1 Tax=Suillus subalutaceus TaxID=48586 RepID=UPI001B87139E|nr:uncharacterized protein DFJ58DRAFT_842658 [Suillus subalutaceus]KAG1849453.1 hypothetical protein DFJ58DRAFT_842658 [Suillus subalutaceus]